MIEARHEGGRRRMAWLLAPLFALAQAGPALAHHGMDDETPTSLAEGLVSGLLHPVIGLDHLVFLIAAGVLAAGCRRGGGAWLPLLFVAASLGGTLLHRAGFAPGPVELAVAVSLLVAGALLLLRPAALAASPRVIATLFLVAGLAHGLAFAEGILGAEPTPLLGYLVGLGLVQAGLACGACILAQRLIGERPGMAAGMARWAGAATSVVGIAALGLALGGV